MNIETLLNLIFVIGTLLATLILGLIKIKSLKGRLIILIAVLIPTIIFIYSFFVPSSIFGKEAIQSFILKFGVFSVLALVSLQVLQVLIPPLDHNVIQFIGGFIFGPWLGFIYNFTGRILGSFLAFSIAKKYGRPFLKRIVPAEEIKKYDKIWNKSRLYVFLAYWLPFFPDDIMSYLAGASKVKPRLFILILLVGHPIGILGTTLAGSFGETFWLKNPIAWAVAISTLLVGIIIFKSKHAQKCLKI